MLEIATPCGVPFTKSSYLDCSHVRVPSANSTESVLPIRTPLVISKRLKVRKFAEERQDIMEFNLRMEKLRVSRQDAAQLRASRARNLIVWRGHCYSRTSLFGRSEEHTPELQSRLHLVCRLL